MKETGIIMSGNHPKLVLDGIKTQTRRVMKPQPRQIGRQLDINYYDSPKIGVTEEKAVPKTWLEYGCPYGQVGDGLWVRERWGVAGVYDNWKPSEIDIDAPVYYSHELGKNLFSVGKTRPSTFMPRWASRITLEITEVRVERVQEITEEDAIKEGITERSYIDINGICRAYDEGYFVCSFEALWDSLNAKRGYGWEVDPWVWVISFKRLNEEG